MLNFSAEFRYLILENSKHKEIRWQISAMKHLFSLYFLIEIQLYDKGKRDNLVQEIDLLFS